MYPSVKISKNVSKTNNKNFLFLTNKKNKKCHTVGTVPKSNRKIIETKLKWILLTHIYVMTALFSWQFWTREQKKKKIIYFSIIKGVYISTTDTDVF